MSNENINIDSVDLLEQYLGTKPKILLITSYTLGLSYLEKMLLSTLKKKFDTKICIVTSKMALNESFDEVVSLNGVGTEYYLFHINDFPYAFHPKVYLAVDEKDELTVFIGGANFTYTGICLNLDAIECIKHHEIGTESRENIETFLTELETNVKSRDFNKFSNQIKNVLKKITDINDETLFVHNFQNPIFNQIMKFVKKKIERVRIISPYFDKDMSTVQKITQDLKIANAQVLSNKNDKSINLSRLPSGTQFYIPDLLERNKLRFVHAKVYIMDAGEHVYTCVGSANCTHSGLMTIPKEGNWEACLLRKHQEKNYANKFWKSFYPKRLKKDKFWIYDSLTKTPGPNYKDLSFNASLSYNLLRIYPIKNFPLKPVDGLLTFLFKSGDEEHINFEHFDFSKAIELPIEADLREQIDSDPVMVELMIKSPEKILGRAWVMQEHQLRKSNKVGSLEKAISQLQNGDPEGWNQALEIISFINKHFKYVSSEPRRRTKNRNKTGEKSLAQKVTTISGVISIDEEFHGEKDTFLFGDLIDFGRSLSKLIEKGFSKQLFNEDEDNDDPEENGIHSDERRKKTKTRRTEPQKSLKYDEIIDQLPSFSEILDKSICKPFYKYLMDAESHQESENINRFEAVLDSLTFCLKLIRFVRLEMSMQVSMPDLQVIIKRYLNEIGSLLRWFWTIYPRIKKIFRLSDEYLYDAFNNTETLNEMCICLIEFWHMNYEERLANRDLFFYALDQFWHLYGMAFVNNSTIQYLESSERFKKGRENLLFDFEKTNDILSNIERYRKRKQSIGKAFDSQVKYLYWCEAEAYHKRALDYYKTHDSHPREKFQEHQKRLKISSCLMNKCISEGKKELGKYYCAKIYEHDRVAGISEMSNELIFARCPSCGHKLDMEIYEELKQFKTLECPGCEKLFIPVDKPGSYVFREAYDPEWDMNPEEIS